MAKTPCVACGKELGMLSFKTKLTDGVVCSGCLLSAGVATSTNISSFNKSALLSFLNARKNLSTKFNPTQKVSSLGQDFFEIDDANRLFRIGFDVVPYDCLLSYELLENGQTVSSGGLGRAVVGGVLLGPVGAVVGGITGKKKSEGVCNSLRISVALKNAQAPVLYIELLKTEAKKSSILYTSAHERAMQCMSFLEAIIKQTEAKNGAQSCAAGAFSAADEILKFKNLLNQGVISQEQFELKKKELLGI